MSGTTTSDAGGQGVGQPSAVKVAWVNAHLGVAFPGLPAPDGATRTAAPMVALQKSRLAWDNVRKAIQSQLAGLESAINQAVEAHNADADAEDEFAPSDVATGTRKLYTILDRLDQRLIDTLDAALNAEGEARTALQAKAKGLVAEYQAFVQQDPMIDSVDKNGFIATAIRPTVTKTLAVLAQHL